MMMFSLKTCAKGFVKSLMLIMNGLCIVLALCMVGLALTDLQITRKYSEEDTFGSTAANTVAVVVSIILMLVAGFGCYGAVKENAKILYVYTVGLLIMVVVELLLGVFIAVQRYGVEVQVVNWIRDDFYRNVTADDLEEHQLRWDRLQINYGCCGVDGPDDYIALGLPVRLSCCPKAYYLKTNQGRQQHYDLCIATKSYVNDGCEDEVVYALRETWDYLLSVAVFALLFEGSGMLMAMWLSNYLKNEVQIYKETLRY